MKTLGVDFKKKHFVFIKWNDDVDSLSEEQDTPNGHNNWVAEIFDHTYNSWS